MHNMLIRSSWSSAVRWTPTAAVAMLMCGLKGLGLEEFGLEGLGQEKVGLKGAGLEGAGLEGLGASFGRIGGGVVTTDCLPGGYAFLDPGGEAVRPLLCGWKEFGDCVGGMLGRLAEVVCLPEGDVNTVSSEKFMGFSVRVLTGFGVWLGGMGV